MDFHERVKRRNEFDASLVYGTRRFNLLTGRDKHAEYRSMNDARWSGPDGIIKPEFSEYRNCPLCGRNDFRVLFAKSGFPHVKCHFCGLVYVNPILNLKEYASLWKDEDSWERVLENKHQVRMQRLEANYSLDVVKLYLKKNPGGISICDVGCGPGTLLIEAKKRGYAVLGIEPNKKTHRFLKKHCIAYTGEFFPLKTIIKTRFDAIFILNSLEHMRDPLKIVLGAKKLLKNGGLIYVSVPSSEALVSRIMHEKAGVFGGHSHLQFFNATTLTLLLEKAGFNVLEYETIITELGVIKNYLGFEDPYFGDTKEHFSYLTPEFIYKNNLARNLNMLARLK